MQLHLLRVTATPGHLPEPLQRVRRRTMANVRYHYRSMPAEILNDEVAILFT